MRTGRDSWIRIINSFLMAHVHLPQPCTTLHNLTVMRQESVVQTAFSTPCVEASLASKASLHRDFNVEVLPADTCQWHMPVSCFHAEICWASDATTHLLILNWSLKWSQALVKTVKTWKSSETLAAFVLVLIFVCRSHLGNLGSNTTWTPTKMTKRFFTHTHTHQKCPCIQGYPGISKASNLLNPRSELRTGWCAQHKESTESTFFADRHKTAEHLHRTLEPRANDTISQSPWQVLQTFYDSTRFMHRLRILNDLNEDN